MRRHITPNPTGRRIITAFPFFCSYNTAQLNSVGIRDTIDATRRGPPGFPVQPSGVMRSDDDDYDVSAKCTLRVCRFYHCKAILCILPFLGPTGIHVRPCFKRYCAACTLPSSSRADMVNSARQHASIADTSINQTLQRHSAWRLKVPLAAATQALA